MATPVENDHKSLQARFGTISLRSPLVAASGCFGYGAEFDSYLSWDSVGAIIAKGISLEPRVGNPPPRIVETPAGMLNSIGLANVGSAAFLEEKLPFLRETGASIWVNFFGETFREYVECARKLSRGAGVAALEMNVSCPNVKSGGMEFGACAETLHKLTKECVEVSSCPIIVKMTPNVTDITAVAQAAAEGGALGVSAINTVLGMAIDLEKRRPVLATKHGGLSGPAIRPVGVSAVYRIRQALPDLPVCASGGVWCGRDVVEYLLAGASCVQIGTLNFTDPGAMDRLRKEVAEALARYELGTVEQSVGLAHNCR